MRSSGGRRTGLHKDLHFETGVLSVSEGKEQRRESLRVRERRTVVLRNVDL